MNEVYNKNMGENIVICDLFGNFSSDELIEITHDYPELKRYADLFDTGINSQIINIEDFFTNPDLGVSPVLKRYFAGKDPLYIDLDYLNDLKEFYLENEKIRNAYITSDLLEVTGSNPVSSRI
jgi:hypothetical protein